MRMRSLPWLLLLLLTVSSYLACQKEYRPGFSLDPNTPGEIVTTSISGRVVNEKNAPVEGALVTAGNMHATTNFDGYFTIENTSVPSDAAFIKVQLQGYFPGSRTITARENGAHYIQVELIPVKKSGEFASATGGTVAFPSGGSAIFPANAIVRESDGSAYTGRVDVSQFLIDPTTEGFTDRMPGDLKGITTSNEVRALQSFGMMAIQLNGEGGEPLQLAQGKKVDLHFPIPAVLASKAPATIPLWFFDEENGLWREEGSATKTGNEYIGQVAHFSFWNCDVPIKFTEISFTLRDQAGNPHGNVRVEIKKKSDSTVASGFTDAEGWAGGWVPLGEALELSVFDACHALIHKRDIGPFSSPTDLGVINVAAGTSASYVLNNGVFVDCNEQNISNGYVNLYFRGRNLRMPLQGDLPISLAFSHCSNEADSAWITVYDADLDKFAVKSIWLTPGTQSLGTIRVCDAAPGQFLKITVDGVKYEFLAPVDSVDLALTGGQHSIIGFRRGGGDAGRIRFPTGGEQPYSTTINDFSVASDSSFFFAWSTGKVDVLKFGAVNDFIEGTFNGQVTDSLSGRTNIPMTGSFRVKRWR